MNGVLNVICIFTDNYIEKFYEWNKVNTLKTSHLSSSSSTTNNAQTIAKKKQKRNGSFDNANTIHKRRKILNSRLSDFLLPEEIRRNFKTRTIATRNEKFGAKKVKLKPLQHVNKTNNNISKKHKKSKLVRNVDENNVQNVESTKLIEEDDVIYILLMSDNSVRNLEVSKTTIEFQRLLRLIQEVTLPSAEWKIKLILRQQSITRIAFSNKAKCERCVHFYRNTYNYQITFGGVKVVLLGAPQIISSLYHLSILLSIVHNISDSDPVLEYCNK